ncbi:MAG: methylated-DNA--[protein]-cysteine S-methyltransferase [Actinomycetota bacterium]
MDGLKRPMDEAEVEARAAAAAQAMRVRAAEEGLVDVAIAEVPSPIGSLLVAVTRRGLVRVAFEDEDRDGVVEHLAALVSPRVLSSAGLTDEVRRELDEYFAGERRRFEVRVDRRLMHPFAQDVLAATARVGYGRLATYGQIAQRIGRPKAARAVGAALGSNPVPVVVPCHRVIGATGSLTGYGGGLSRKQALLALEGSLPPGR